MSDRIDIPANEHGIVRLFTIDLPPDQVATFTERSNTPGDTDGPTALENALGASFLDTDFVEVFPVCNLGELGLSGYLTEGLGIAAKDIADQRAQLDAIKGHVLIVLSSAFDGSAQTLTPRSPLRWIGTWSEDRPPVEFSHLPSDGAKGTVPPPTKSPPSDAAMSGRIAMVALLVMFALVGLMVWVAS